MIAWQLSSTYNKIFKGAPEKKVGCFPNFQGQYKGKLQTRLAGKNTNMQPLNLLGSCNGTLLDYLSVFQTKDIFKQNI